MCKRNVISLLRDVIFISLQVVAVCKKRVYIVDRIRVFFLSIVHCISYKIATSDDDKKRRYVYSLFTSEYYIAIENELEQAA